MKFVIANFLILLSGATTQAAPPAALAPFLKQHCVACHDADSKAGGLDLAALGDNLQEAATQARWVRIHDRVRDGEMPPRGESPPAVAARNGFLKTLSDDLTRAHARSKGTVLRRLNRSEYERTLNALFGTNVQVAEMLPEDGRAHGFDNISEALDLSPAQMQRYLEAAGLALDACVTFGLRPEAKTQTLTFDTGRNADQIGKAWIKRPDGAVVVSTECCSPVKVYELRISHNARYRVRLTVSTHQTESPLVYRVHAGRDFFDSIPLHGISEAHPGDARVEEFDVRLRPNETVRLFPHLPTYWLPAEKIAKYEGAGLALHQLEVEGPLFDEWPSRGHRLRFGDIPAEDTGPKNQRDKPWYRPQWRLVSKTPAADLSRVLPPFLKAVFRRPVDEETAAPFIAIGQQELADGASLEQALRTAQIAALCAPDFLFLWEPDSRLDDFALAARLSYMLWGVPPDQELLDLAARKQLLQSHVLREQTERLLVDARSRQFTSNVTGQWLNLREIDFTTPDKQLYPEYDLVLRHAMLRETELFFDEVLTKNLRVLEFIDSDWTYLNERLAKHYGIDGVAGVSLRRVALKPEHHRGGVLTHASVLKVSANGTTTSPVTRGAFVLSRMLGIDPPPPPPGVPGVEPDIRGATTLREQLAKHRSLESCNACHRVIDPPGFALESYDVMGGWRKNYRSLGKDFPKPDASQTGGRNVAWRVGPSVDASGQTPAGQSFADLSEYKRLLLTQPQQFTRALAEKLATYATGRGMGFSDRDELDRITQRVAARNDGFRDLLHEVVQSDLFQTK